MKRYAIWNKNDPILTPVGEVLTPAQWIERYPIAGLASVTVVCSAGEINGGFFGTIGQMVPMYEDMGCDFSGCVTAEDKLAAIEAFESVKDEEAKAMAKAKAEQEISNALALASIAASMEYQNMLTLPDEEE